MAEPIEIGMFGAGSIGMYVGGRLLAAGNRVRFVGRAAMARDTAGGIELSRYDGAGKRIDGAGIRFSTETGTLRDCAIVLVCVKSTGTLAAGQALARAVGPDTCIVSLQNGIANAGTLRTALPNNPVVAAMVGFNVARIGANRFHQGSEGEIVLQAGSCGDSLASRLAAAGVPARAVEDIDAVLWSKLLLNLNNAVNALSGLPLKRQLSQRRHRLLLADCVAEALAAMRAAGIRPMRLGKVAPQWLPALLRLPDFIFTRLAGAMLKIDEAARSSMAEDLERGREPEIDFLNGEIVRLGEKVGVATPVNRLVISRIRDRFAQR